MSVTDPILKTVPASSAGSPALAAFAETRPGPKSSRVGSLHRALRVHADTLA